MGPVTPADIRWEHVRELLAVGYDEHDATALAYAALARVTVPRWCPVGVALHLRRPPPPERPS